MSAYCIIKTGKKGISLLSKGFQELFRRHQYLQLIKNGGLPCIIQSHNDYFVL